jgi:hypothetical protein
VWAQWPSNLQNSLAISKSPAYLQSVTVMLEYGLHDHRRRKGGHFPAFSHA